MMILATNWTSAWLMTGMGFGVVFAILVLLVLVLQVFNIIATQGENKSKHKNKTATSVSDFKEQVEGYEEDMAAVATAVSLHLNNMHDVESGILTIQQDEHSLWHAELNETV